LDWTQNQQRYGEYRATYDIAESFTFQGESTKLNGDGEIQIDPGGYIGGSCKITCVPGTAVHIGRCCAIGSNVRLYTQNALPEQSRLDKSDRRTSEGDVELGEGVWIGDNVFITEDTTIGANSVIGENSVVTEDIDSNTLAAGALRSRFGR